MSRKASRLGVGPSFPGSHISDCRGRETGGILDSAEQVLPQKWLGITFPGMPQCRTPDATSFGLVVPRDGVVLAHRPTLVGAFVDGDQNVRPRTRIRVEVIPFLGPAPRLVHSSCRRVIANFSRASRLLDCRVPVEFHAADERNVPRPFVERRDPLVHGCESAALTDESLESRFLVSVQDLARCVEKDDCSIVGQLLRCEHGGILGRVDRESAIGGERLDRADASRNRVMTESGRPRKHEHSRRWRFCDNWCPPRDQRCNDHDRQHIHGANSLTRWVVSHNDPESRTFTQADWPLELRYLVIFLDLHPRYQMLSSGSGKNALVVLD